MNDLIIFEINQLNKMLKFFDWKFYVSYYDDLLFIKDEKIAINHYKKYGFKEGRFCCQIHVDIKETNLCVQINIDKNTIIYYSKTNYKHLFQRSHQIMHFFDKSFNKIFIGFTNKIRYKKKYNLWIVPYKNKTKIYELFNTYNAKLITYYTDPRLYNEIENLKGEKMFDLIDAPIDDLIIWKSTIETCVIMADYVIYSHQELVTFLNDIDNTKTYYYISNGCDYDMFSQSKNRIGERPLDFPKTDKQILGYYGSFAKWLDYDVIRTYADKEIYHIVMIGGIPNCPRYNIRIEHSNITWLEYKPYDELPYYLSWFDVCFLPFKNCEITKYINPCKLWEYMASEKEIIKTNVNINCSIIIKYEDECKKFLNLLKYNDIFKFNDIKQLVCSDCLSYCSLRFKNKYNLVDYSDNNKKTAYFGIYSINDINKIKLNTTTKLIIFAGTDIELIFENNKLKKLFDSIDNKILCHISNDIGNRLKSYGYTSIFFQLDLIDKTIFKKVNSDDLGQNIFIYNGRIKGLEQNYNKELYEDFVIRNPHFTYIYSNELQLPYENMPNIYKKCFIGLRLTYKDGNANMVKEFECMGIPVIHNHSNYGIKWKTIEHIEKIIDIYINYKNILIEKYPISFYNLYTLYNDTLIKIYNNINNFIKYIEQYNNILFICGDYPGYGGAATNCFNLSNYFQNKNHNTYSIYFNYDVKYNTKCEQFLNYCIISSNKLKFTLNNMLFKPDLIILKSPININIKTIINNCPIYYIIGGIYLNTLDKHHELLDNKIEQDKYINKNVLKQIQYCDKSFCNSFHTQQILKKFYNINTNLFYSSFIKYNNITIDKCINFEERKYDYGLIISNFNRKIKNVKKSIEFLKDKQNVILIGSNSSNYKSYGFECVELVEVNKMVDYYKQIKYIQQDSFYESCSNTKIECLYNGCKIKPNIIISSTQYPGYGGAATNAYQLIKYFRKNGYNVFGIFFDNKLNIDYDPDNIGGVYLYPYKYNKNKIRMDAYKYLKASPNVCLVKNYLAPQFCKEIFNCSIIYLVSGINHFRLFYPLKSATEVLDENFIIDNNFEPEIITNTLADKIILNSHLTKQLFIKIYPQFMNKISNEIVDTTFAIQKHELQNKLYDIIISCSILTRKDKNNLFLIDVLNDKRLDKYTKIIIGSDNNLFNSISNSLILDIQSHYNSIDYLNKSKILLFPSLFDSNSNTIREATFHNCMPIITRNIGFNELFPSYLICDSYNIEEWVNKIIYALENYDEIVSNNTIFTNNNNINIDTMIYN
jgi:hypothetical protein